jgi:phage baseplate assembly protein gpV
MILSGVYRGIVEDVEDPQKRFRVRVRVATLHLHTTPVVCLPWAEVSAAFAAPGAVDLPHYERGDRVFVLFEGGDSNNPVVVGSWIAARGGLSDIPTDITQDYSNTRRKWSRVDRVGNMVEMSEVPSELHVRLKSGKATITITQKDDSIILKTTGAVTISGEQVSVSSAHAYLSAKDITLSAVDASNPLLPKGTLNLFSNRDLNIYVNEVAQGGATDAQINIGQYVDKGQLTSGGIPAPHQSPKVNIFSALVNIGQYDSLTLYPTTTVVLAASANVHLKSSALVSIAAPAVSITGSLAIDGNTTSTGTITAAGEIQSGLIPLTLHKHPYTDDGNPSVTSLPIP